MGWIQRAFPLNAELYDMPYKGLILSEKQGKKPLYSFHR